jgi:hypothetical protein
MPCWAVLVGRRGILKHRQAANRSHGSERTTRKRPSSRGWPKEETGGHSGRWVGMSTRNIAGALGLSVLTVASSAFGAAGRFLYLDGPPPEPLSPPPAPARDADEFPRRSWELFPEAGLTAPFCRGDALGAARCGDAAAGTALGGGALYRVSPYVALGLEASFVSFRVGAAGFPAASSRTNWVGLLVRGYFVDRGAVDPYVETGLGRGASVAGYFNGIADVRSDASGPSAMAGAGVDFWVTPYVRFGPAFSYRWTWLTDVRTCAASTCETARVADSGAVGSYATLSVLATFAFGHEM